MTKLNLLTLFALLPLTAAALPEPKTVPQISGSCGLAPLPPLGCSPANAACLCAAEGQCRWVFVGCQ